MYQDLKEKFLIFFPRTSFLKNTIIRVSNSERKNKNKKKTIKYVQGPNNEILESSMSNENVVFFSIKVLC